MNDFPFSDDNKRYHTLSHYNRSRGVKLYKAAIDAGFTCPNKDGTRGKGGCIFCSSGSGYFTQGKLSVSEQLDAEIKRIRAKTPDARVIAYFQANSSTYADVKTLERLYREALQNPFVDGLSIATRADCLDTEKIELLSELNKETSLTVELGLQTIHDETARLINRGHTFSEFLSGYNLLKSAGIRTCVHIINGLPEETTQMMEETAETLGKLRPDGVKIHLLHIIKGTPLERMYLDGKMRPLEKDEYIDIVIRQLELLPPETVIERITGDGDRKTLAAPLWSLDKISVLGGIDKRMAILDTQQGRRFFTN